MTPVRSQRHGGIAFYSDILTNMEEVYNRHTTEKQSAETAEASQDVQQRRHRYALPHERSYTSKGKGSEKDGDGQIAPGARRNSSMEKGEEYGGIFGEREPLTVQRSLFDFMDEGEGTNESGLRPDTGTNTEGWHGRNG